MLYQERGNLAFDRCTRIVMLPRQRPESDCTRRYRLERKETVTEQHQCRLAVRRYTSCNLHGCNCKISQSSGSALLPARHRQGQFVPLVSFFSCIHIHADRRKIFFFLFGSACGSPCIGVGLERDDARPLLLTFGRLAPSPCACRAAPILPLIIDLSSEQQQQVTHTQQGHFVSSLLA